MGVIVRFVVGIKLGGGMGKELARFLEIEVMSLAVPSFGVWGPPHYIVLNNLN